MRIIKQCRCCGKEFIATKITSLYCSNACNHKVQHQKESVKKRSAREASWKQENQDQDFNTSQQLRLLKVADLQMILKVSHATIYRLFAKGIIKAVQIGNCTYVRQEDLESFFESNDPYKKRQYRRKCDIEGDFYTVKQITEKYHICKKAVLRRCEVHNITKHYEGRNIFFNRKAVDKYFAELIEEIDLDNYYTVQQLMEKLHMTKQNVLSFVYHNNIPRVTRGRSVFYSKVHIDSYKRLGDDVDPNWYTYAELIEKYGLTKDRISYFIKHEKLHTEKRGKFTMISRSEFDKKVLNGRFKDAERDEEGNVVFIGSTPPTPKEEPRETPESPEGYYSAEELSEKYKATRKRVLELGREQKLPAIEVKGWKYFEKEAADNFFGNRKCADGIKEWMTPEEVQKEYGMTPDARRSFVHRHKIPTKTEFGKLFYSKDHIDKVKGLCFDDREKYYSVGEAMSAYNMSKDRVFYYTKQYKVSKIHQGQYVFILKEEFDALMKKIAEKYELPMK